MVFQVKYYPDNSVFDTIYIVIQETDEDLMKAQLLRQKKNQIF